MRARSSRLPPCVYVPEERLTAVISSVALRLSAGELVDREALYELLGNKRG